MTTFLLMYMLYLFFSLLPATCVAAHASLDIKNKVVPWLLKQAAEHKTLRLWADFLLEDYPAYLMFRTGGRTANYKLCVAAFRKLAPLFVATGKNRYQQLASWHLLNLARMTDEDLEAISTLFTSQFDTTKYENFNNVFLDEFMEMINRVVKQNLGRITQTYMLKLPRICDSRRAACDEVDSRLYPSYKDRDARRSTIRDRVRAIRKAKKVLENSFAFSEEGRDQLRALSGAVTTEKNSDSLLNATAIALAKFKKILLHEALGDRKHGTRPSNQRLSFFKPESTTSALTKPRAPTSTAHKDFKDMTLLATEFLKIITEVMTSEMTEEERETVMSTIGAVLPMALSRSEDGGGVHHQQGERGPVGDRSFLSGRCPIRTLLQLRRFRV